MTKLNFVCSILVFKRVVYNSLFWPQRHNRVSNHISTSSVFPTRNLSIPCILKVKFSRNEGTTVQFTYSLFLTYLLVSNPFGNTLADALSEAHSTHTKWHVHGMAKAQQAKMSSLIAQSLNGGIRLDKKLR